MTFRDFASIPARSIAFRNDFLHQAVPSRTPVSSLLKTRIRGEHSLAVSVDQQRHRHMRRMLRRSAAASDHLETRLRCPVNHFQHKMHHVVRWYPIAKIRRQQHRRVTINIHESITHDERNSTAHSILWEFISPLLATLNRPKSDRLIGDPPGGKIGVA